MSAETGLSEIRRNPGEAVAGPPMGPRLSPPLGAGLTVTSGREAQAERPDVTRQPGGQARNRARAGHVQWA